MSGEITIERVSAIVSLIREDILKGGQYAFIFLTWLYERSKNEKLTHEWFSLYQKLFHSRRLFRVMSFIVYAPRIIELSLDLKRSFSLKSIF